VAARARSNHAGNRESYRVVPRTDGGEEVFLIVAPTGVPLYSFTDLRAATSEVAELNSVSTRSR